MGSEFQFSKVNKFLGVDGVKALGVLHTVKLIIYKMFEMADFPLYIFS